MTAPTTPELIDPPVAAETAMRGMLMRSVRLAHAALMIIGFVVVTAAGLVNAAELVRRNPIVAATVLGGLGGLVALVGAAYSKTDGGRRWWP